MKSLKLITIGEAGVGKTALTMRYANETFDMHEMTIGVDFAIKRMNDGGKIQIWDTAGQEAFRSISRSYYRGAHGCLIVFSLNDLRSFHKVQSWYEDFREINEDALCVLVGTKSELQRKVQDVQIKELCESLNLEYFETSAKCNTNVSSAFDSIYKHCDCPNNTIEIKPQGETIERSDVCCF